MKTAMILAAGRGERLRPLTESIPKAMVPIQGLPLIAHHVKRLAAVGIEKIVINHAYLGGKIRQYLKDGSAFGVSIHYTPEPPGGLETGGGIVNALPFLGYEPFITVNADIYTDYPFEKLVLPEKMLLHLVLVPTPAHRAQGDFGLRNENLLNNQTKEYVFSGIACYDPQCFETLSVGRYSITPHIRQLANAQRVSGEIYQGQWIDIGSQDQLALAQRGVLIT